MVASKELPTAACSVDERDVMKVAMKVYSKAVYLADRKVAWTVFW